MSAAKKIGIWMDHSVAHLTVFTEDPMHTTSIESKFTHQSKEESLSRSESLMHHKEQRQQADYYNKLGEVIRNYEGVILFGPTDAKSELMNILKADHHFANINIEIHPADKMTVGEQHIFVKKHFAENIFRNND
jgi:hypothetical protein